MTVISILSRLIDGVQRNVDLSTNTLKVDILQALTHIRFGGDGAAGTEVTKTQIDSLLSHDHASGSDNQNVTAGDGLTGGGSGASPTLAVGAGSGISVTADAVAVDSTVVRTTGSTMGSDADLTFAGGGEVLGLPVSPSGDGAATSKKYVNDQDALKLNLTGGTMSGNIAMGSSKITGMADGSGANDAVNKSQLDTKATISTVVLRDGTQSMSADLDLNSHKVINVTAGTNSGDAVNITQLGTKADDSVVIKKGGTVAFTADQSMGGFKLTNVGTPLNGGDAVNKTYADGIAAGFDAHLAARLATSTDLSATPSGTKVGKTLTATVAGPLSLDGFLGVVSDRILVKTQSDPIDNGMYILTTQGVVDVKASVVYDTVIFEADTAGVAGNSIALVFNGTTDDLTTVVGAWNTANPSNTVSFSGQAGSFIPTAGTATLINGVDAVLWVLTRAADMDGSPASEAAAGDTIYVNTGVSFGGTSWVIYGTGLIDVDVAAMNWTQVAGISDIQAGNGLTKTGTVLDVNVDGSTLEINGDALRVKDAGITAAKLAAAVAGDGLQGGAGSALSVKVDGQGLETSTGTLVIELDGTTLAKSSAGLKVNAIANAQIASGAAITLNKLESGSDAQVVVCSGAGVPTYVTMSGDVTISNTGVMAIGATKVTNGMLAGSIADSKLSQITTANKVAGSAVQLKASGGLKDSTGLAVEPADIAGNGLEDNGSDKLQIKLASNSGLVCDASGLAVAGGSSAVLTAGESFAANTSFLVRFAMSGETAGRVYKADDDASSSDKFYVMGVVQPAISVAAGDAITVYSFGSLTLGASDTAFGAGDIGKAIYLSGTGGFSVTAPTSVGHAAVRIGMVQLTNKMWIQHPQVTGIN